jgi:hypothetical protein
MVLLTVPAPVPIAIVPLKAEPVAMFIPPVVSAPPIEIDPVVIIVFHRAAAVVDAEALIVSMTGVVIVGEP